MVNIIKAITDKDTRLVAGVNSGATFEGIDVAFVRISGNGEKTKASLVSFESVPHEPFWRAELLMNSSPDTGSVADICRINKLLGVKIGEAVLLTAKHAGIDMGEVDFVSSHGQLMYQMPDIRAVVQIGELADIAAVTGKLTVGEFRSSDMAYGGLGAPMLPFMDFLLDNDKDKNNAIFNIGNIGSLTFIPANSAMDSIVAFDTGPGNVLIDSLMRLHSRSAEHFDSFGSLAASGRQSLKFSEYLADLDSFVTLKPPKTAGRERYTMGFAERIMRRGREMGLEFADILATVTNHTAYSLWYALTYLTDMEADCITITGGGTKNRYLMKCLEEHFPGKIKEAQDVPADAKEAMSFAILGNEFLFGGVNNVPGATGADRGVIMGKMTLPSLRFK